MTDEMPPFRVQTIEPVAPHGGLQKPQVRSDLGIHSVVMKHCRRCELVEIGRHRYRSAPTVRPCCVDSHAPCVQPPDSITRIGDVRLVMRELPELALHGFRPIRIPTFKAELVRTQEILRTD